MANRYIRLNAAGQLAELEANATSAGAADAGKIVALDPAGKIDATMLASAGTESLLASEPIGAGAFINVWNDAGTRKVRNADNASSAKRADGFATAAIASGASGNVSLREGKISGLTGLTPGTRYFLGAAGAVTATIPTVAGTIVQDVGVSLSATELSFLPGDPILRA